MQLFQFGDSKWDLLKKILQNQLDFWNAAYNGMGEIFQQISPAASPDWATVPDITVTVAGTAVQGLDIPCKRGILLVADPDNQGPVYIGGSDVSNKAGGKRGIILSQSGMPSILVAVSNVNLIWLNADHAGDRVGVVRI